MDSNRGRIQLEVGVAVFVVMMIAWTLPPQCGPTQLRKDSADAEFRLALLRCALQSYHADHSATWPQLDAERGTIRGLTETPSNGTPGRIGSNGPYLEAIPINPFTGSCRVRPPKSHRASSSSGEVDGWEYNDATGEIWLVSDPQGNGCHSRL